MYNKVKLSKRQIKEDKFTTFMLNTKQFAQENWQFLIIGVAVVVLVIVAVVYMMTSSETRQLEASTRFSRALLDYRNGNNQVAILSFTQILDEFAGDQVAEQSTFLLGKINLDTRNYPEAIRYFEMYLSQYADNKLTRSAALGGIASCYENQGQAGEAAANFIEAYEEYTDGPLSGDYALGAMRNLLEIGDIEAARQYLTFIEENMKGTDTETRAHLLFAEKSRR